MEVIEGQTEKTPDTITAYILLMRAEDNWWWFNGGVYYDLQQATQYAADETRRCANTVCRIVKVEGLPNYQPTSEV